MIVTLKAHPKQEIALKALTQNNEIREVLFGGAKNGGKSFLGASWLCASALLYPETYYFMARHELNDLRKYTVPTVMEFFKVNGIDFDSRCKFNGQDNMFVFNNGSKIFLLSCKYMPSDPLYERFGSSQFTQGWIEEGGEVDAMAYQNLKLALGRWNNDKYGLPSKLLITCNPKKNWMYLNFFKPFKDKTLPASKCFIQSLVTDNTYRQSGSVETLDGITDKVARMRLRFGEWEYEDDPAQLIEYDKILDIFTNNFIEEGHGYITADIARFGKDNTVIIVWNGWRAEKIITLSKSSITDTAAAISELQMQYIVPNSNVIVDEDGVGGGAKDILKCKGFVNNARAIGNDNYSNLKSQCYFKLSERINKAGVYINCEDDKLKETITEELEQIKQKDIDKDGKKSVIPKEDVKDILGRSPDYADAIMMREYFDMTKKLIF